MKMSCAIVCRACLASKVRMFRIAETRLQNKFEEISKTKFARGDGKPDTLCYICYALLKKFCNFVAMTQTSEKVFRLFLGKGVQITYHSVSQLNIKKPNLCVTRLKSISNISPKMPVPVVDIKKEDEENIEIDLNNFPETEEMREIMKEFEDFTNIDINMNDDTNNCKTPIKHNFNNNKIQNPAVSDDDRIQENSPNSMLGLSSTIGKICEIQIEMEHPVDDDEDCFILEKKNQPIVIEECRSNGTENKEIPLVIDEELIMSAQLQQKLLKEIELQLPIKEEANDPSIENDTKELKTLNTAFTSLFGESDQKTKESRIRTNKSVLRPCDLGLQRADINENLEPEYYKDLSPFQEENTDDAAMFVPLANETLILNSPDTENKHSNNKKNTLPQPGNHKYYCDYCFKSFLSRRYAKKHIKRIHPEKDTYPSRMCNKSYCKESDLTEHFRKDHIKECYMYTCDRCRKQYLTLKYLKIHMDRKHPEKLKVYACNVCRKKFTQRLSFKNHVLFVHPQDQTT